MTSSDQSSWSRRQFLRAKHEGRLGLIFGFQDTTSLGEDLTRFAPRCGGTDDRPLRDGVRAGWDPIHDADRMARRSLLGFALWHYIMGVIEPIRPYEDGPQT